MDGLTDYVLNNYFDDDAAQFPVKVWCDFTAITTRTTNSCDL